MLTKEQLLKLYDLKLITLVIGEDVLLNQIKGMSDNDALNHLKNLGIFNHVINNDEILNLFSDDVNAITEVDGDDDVVNPTTKDDDVVNPTTKDDDAANPTTKDDEDDSPIVDDGE